MPSETKPKPVFVRAMTDKLVAPDNFGSVLQNLLPTRRGTLRSIVGPLPFLPALSTVAAGPTFVPVKPSYFGTVHGIFRHKIRDREFVLIHDADSVRVFQGWSKDWGDGGLQSGGDCLLGPNSRTPLRVVDLSPPAGPHCPIQWLGLPNGILIIPPSGRAWFFDGYVVGYLGYSAADTPSAPIGDGPKTVSTPNDQGYTHDNITGHSEFGNGRKGTVEIFPGTTGNITVGEATPNAGNLLRSEYRAAVQLQDRWGNLSARSPPSAPVLLAQQTSDDAGTYVLVDKVLKHIAWKSVAVGPQNTVGRILLVSRDLVNSGSSELWELSLDAAGGAFSTATLPDNVVTYVPDNVPDTWQVVPAIAVQAVPEFRFACHAFGRLIIGGIRSNPSRILASREGLWGTFDVDAFSGVPGAVTGLARCAEGVLVFTENSVSVLTKDLSSRILSNIVGCPAASTVQTLGDGRVVWLSYNGFAEYKGGIVSVFSQEDLTETFERISPSRIPQAVSAIDPKTGIYFCAVAEQGATNNILYSYDGFGFGRHVGHRVTQFIAWPETGELLYSGEAQGKYRVGAYVDAATTGNSGVWSFNVENYTYDNADRVCKIATGWLGVVSGPTRTDVFYAYLWAYEGSGEDITISIERDYRARVVSTQDISPASDGRAESALLGTTVLGATDAYWTKTMPIWRSAPQLVQQGMAYRVSATRTTSRPWEIFGLAVNENPREFAEGDVP